MEICETKRFTWRRIQDKSNEETESEKRDSAEENEPMQ